MTNKFATPLSNKDILKLAKSDPTYASWTAGLTDEIFTERGFESFGYSDAQDVADFFNMSVRIYLGKIRRPDVNIPSSFESIVERMANVNGGLQQRIATKLMKPTNPKYRNLQNNGSIDPFVIRKPETMEYFFKQNFDFASNVTIQKIDMRKMFLEQNGISDYIAAVMYGFDQGKTIQEFELVKETFSKMLNSTNNPLKASQKIEVNEIDEDSTNADMAKFIQVFHNLHDLMTSTVVSSEFNAKSYAHGLNPSDYVLFVRSDILNQIKTTLMATTYHTENLGIPFTVKGVKDFGGISYSKKIESVDTPMLPVYSTGAGNEGELLGFNATGLATDPYYQPEELDIVDPNADVDAVLVQKGAIFMTEQNGYETSSIYNPRGMYTNFFANQPNKTVGYDATYDIIKFYHDTTSTKGKSNKKVREVVEA